jgi:glycosyltransferase involved in cell wall biosynthesis
MEKVRKGELVTEMPLVSIVTPSFNQAAFLEETIRSVLEQDYSRIEYIIIDGGSTDGSVEIIEKYASRLAYWVSERDAGQADAINKGWKRATGEIVAYLNSDDMYERGAVRAAAEHLRQSAETALVFGHCYQMDPTGKRVGIFRSQPFKLKNMLFANMIMQPTVFVRRTALDVVGLLDPSFHFAMDYDLWLRIALKFRLDALPRALANFRAHRESKTFGQPYGFVRDVERALARAFADENFPSELKQFQEPAYIAAFLRTILVCYALDQVPSGKILWNQMVSRHPDYLEQPETVIEIIANNAVHMVETPWLARSNQDAVTWLHRMLDDLPSSAESLRRLAPRIESRIYTIRAFEAYWQRDYATARTQIKRAWRADMHALTNRGLASIWLESWIGAPRMERWRRRRRTVSTAP